MSEAAAETANADASETTSETGDGKDWKSEAEKWQSLSKKNERDLKKLQGELETFRAESMSEAEKAVAQRVREASAPLQSENLRLRVALAKGLPADLVDRLKGESQDEIEADADALLALFQKPEPEPEEEADTFPDLGQGNRGDAPPALGSDDLFRAVSNVVGVRKRG